MRCEERLDVVAVHWGSAVEAEIRANWTRSVKIPEADTSQRGCRPPTHQVFECEYHAWRKSALQALASA